MMAKQTACVYLGLLVGGLCTGNVPAQEDRQNSWAAELEYRSRYLFAGFPLSTGPVMLTTLEASFGDLVLTAYTSYDKDGRETSEADLFAEYYFNYSDRVSFYIGAGNLNFKNAVEVGRWDSTYEVYAGVISTFPGNPELHYVRDLNLSDGGQTLTVSLAHEISFGSVKMIGSGNLVYNDQYYRLASNLSYYDLNLAAKFGMGSFTLTPKISYQKGIAHDFEDFWVGILNLRKDF